MTDTSLINIASRKISNNTQLQNIFVQAEAKTLNLVPSTMVFGARPELVLGFTLIFVNTEFEKYTWNGKQFDQKSNGDIFLVDKKTKRYALHLRKLKEIAQAAGVIIKYQKEIDRQLDENNKLVYVKFELGWERMDIDGSIKNGIQIGEYSYVAQLEKYKKENDDNLDFVEKQRGDGAKLAMSNALSRAIKDSLPKMAATFTIEELKKPFLVPCVIKDLSKLLAKHPDLEKLLLAKELGVANMMFGQPDKMLVAPHIQDEILPPNLQMPNNPKAEDNDQQPAEAPTIAPVTSPTTIEPPVVSSKEQEKYKIYANEFFVQPAEIRVNKVKDLLQKKGKAWAWKKTKIEDCTPQQHVDFIAQLLALPDSVEEAKVIEESTLPFSEGDDNGSN